jgi:hypothetical protein
LQYDGKIDYVKGEDNSVADALSHIPLNDLEISSTSKSAETKALPLFHDTSSDGIVASIFSVPSNLNNLLSEGLPSIIASISQPTPMTPSVLSISSDSKLLKEIKDGYPHDPFIKSLQDASPGTSFVTQRDGFWFMGNRLIIPNVAHIREALFYLAHDVVC